jgi:hypothetical protein
VEVLAVRPTRCAWLLLRGWRAGGGGGGQAHSLRMASPSGLAGWWWWWWSGPLVAHGFSFGAGGLWDHLELIAPLCSYMS